MGLFLIFRIVGGVTPPKLEASNTPEVGENAPPQYQKAAFYAKISAFSRQKVRVMEKTRTFHPARPIIGTLCRPAVPVLGRSKSRRGLLSHPTDNRPLSHKSDSKSLYHLSDSRLSSHNWDGWFRIGTVAEAEPSGSGYVSGCSYD